MNPRNEVFFAKEGEHGITATSANYLCNIAKEMNAEIEAELQDVHFVDTTVQIPGSDPMFCSAGKGSEFIQSLEKKLFKISERNRFCAWFRSAISAKEEERSAVADRTFEYKSQALEAPNKEAIKAQVIGEMDIKERQAMLRAEATACAYKCLHPDGAVNKARKELVHRKKPPVWVDKEDGSILIYGTKATVDSAKLDAVFFGLQAKYRAAEAELNKYKNQIEKEVSNRFIAAQEVYLQKLQERREDEARARAEFRKQKEEDLRKVKNLKIRIPNDLKEIYDALNSIGKS